MKRLLWIPMLFLCLPLWAAEPVQLARTNPYIAGAGVAAACGDVTKDSKTGDVTSSNGFSYSTTAYGIGFSLSASSSYTVTKVRFKLAKVGSPTFNFKAYLCTGDGTVPTSCTASTDSMNAADLTTDTTNCADYYFTFTGYSVTNGTEYWAAVIPVDGTPSTSNYGVVRGDVTGTGDKAEVDNASSWTNADTSYDGNFSLIACE